MARKSVGLPAAVGFQIHKHGNEFQMIHGEEA